MGDIGESAVLRYLIINEIRKVPAFKPNRELEASDWFKLELPKHEYRVTGITLPDVEKEDN